MLSASSILLRLPAQLIIKEKDLGQRSNSRWPGYLIQGVHYGRWRGRLYICILRCILRYRYTSKDLINSLMVGFSLLRIFWRHFFLSISLLNVQNSEIEWQKCKPFIRKKYFRSNREKNDVKTFTNIWCPQWDYWLSIPWTIIIHSIVHF